MKKVWLEQRARSWDPYKNMARVPPAIRGRCKELLINNMLVLSQLCNLNYALSYHVCCRSVRRLVLRQPTLNVKFFSGD